MKHLREHPSYYVGDTLHKAKQEKIQKAITDNNLEGILLLKSEAVRYVTDFYAKGYRPFFEPEYLVVVPKNNEPVVGFTSGSDEYRIKIRSDIKDHRKLPGLNKWHAEIIKIFKDYGITAGRVGTDMLPFGMHQELKVALPKVEFIDLSDIWIELTVIKHPVEIECLRKAVEITEKGFTAAFEAIKPGVREFEVAARAEYCMKLAGSEMSPFLPIVASGVNCSIFERIATDKVIRAGEMVILDLGCIWRGYTGDLGRTVCVGEPSREQKRIYRVNYLALQEAIKAVKPGVACGEIDAVARKVIREEGYEKYEHKFATGHQLGYGLHGAPLIAKGVEYMLKPGMVMALEPRVTAFDNPEIGGSHLEDAVLVTEDGYEKISHLRFEEALLL